MSSFKFKADTIFICEEYVKKKEKRKSNSVFFFPALYM